jgi:transcriptional regulator with XRE-family HTH domain
MGKNNFSDSLRKLRTWKSVSQKDLGKAMGVTDTTISAWENPKLDRIPPKSMVDLLVEFFEKEIKETSIDLYMDAGYFSSEQKDKVERRLATIEKQLSILVEAYRVDKDV